MNVQALRKPSFDKSIIADAAQSLIKVGKFFDGKGWAPATSGNYSARLDAEFAAITLSGAAKGSLTPESILLVDMEGMSQDARKPSAETPLHTMLYKLDDKIGSVLHTHSVNSVVLSRLLKNKKKLKFSDYEIQKAFGGVETHETEIVVPIFDNTQDMVALAEEAREKLEGRSDVPGFLVRGHGLYAWGTDVHEAQKAVEA
jgi:methylthioribulose-1-phosphate dehydratase